MSRILLFAFFVMMCCIGISQQAPLYNQYHVAPLIYNPSYTGFDDGVSITLIRNQKWGNYGEGFNANSLSAGTLLRDGKSGLGVSLYNDYVGITSKLNAHLLYSYRIKLGENSNLRAGIAAGIVDNRINFNDAIVSDPNDPVIMNTAGDRKTMFDLNVGLNFNFSDFRIGLSVPQILGSKLLYSDLTQSSYTLERQLILNSGYLWYLNRDKGIIINPEALLIYSFPGTPLNYCFNLIFELEKIAWLGVAYKSNYAMSFNVGVNIIRNVKFGLAYDMQINSVAAYNSRPNMEIMLKYTIPSNIQIRVENNTELENKVAEQQRQLDSLNNALIVNDSTAHIKIQNLENNNQALTEDNQTLEKENQILVDSLSKWPEYVNSSNQQSGTYNTSDNQQNTSGNQQNTNSNQQSTNSNQQNTTGNPQKDTVKIVTNPVIDNPGVDTVRTTNIPPIVSSDVKSNSGDHFIELSGKDSPNGYYLISGAFAEKNNADALLRKIKGKFPNARVIKNKRNNLYYVMLYHSLEKDEGLAYASYKAKNGVVEETWVLEYAKGP